MSAASYLGNSTFREISRVANTVQNGFDTLTVVRRGARSLLGAESTLNPKGSADTIESSMYLVGKSTRDAGNFGTIELHYNGFLGEADSEGGLVGVSQNINAQTVSLTTDADEVVDFSYRARTAAWRWIHRGENAPKSPKFKLVIDSSVSVGNLFDPEPPTFEGSVQKKLVARLDAFNVERVTRGVWFVTEVWIQKIEATKTIS